MENNNLISGISACLIVKNEEDTLEECLKSLQPWVEEICIVDTGSSDNTLGIAEKYNARIAHFTWNDSFAEARNVSLEMAKYSWILVIDADERLTRESGPTLRKLIEKKGVLAYTVFQENEMSSGVVQSIAIPRVFRNLPEIRYTRAVHESIMESLIRHDFGNPESSDIRLIHLGYLPEQIEKHNKKQRNKNILRKELVTRGDDLYTLYKFAQTLKDPSEKKEKWSIFDRAIGIAQNFTSQERGEYPFIWILYSNYIESLVLRGQLSKAVSFIRHLSVEANQIPEVVWRNADLAFRVGDLGMAMNEFQRCLNLAKPDEKIPSDPRFRGIAARMRLGDIALELGDTNSFFKIVGEMSGTDEYAENCRIQRIRALLSIGENQRAGEELVSLSSMYPEEPPALLLLKAHIARIHNQDKEAIEFLRKSADDSDAGQKARAWMALMALQKGELHEAERLVGEIVVRETETASMVLLVNVILEKEIQIDRAFLQKFLLQKLVYWLGELVEFGEQSILENFIENSKKYSSQYPGIDSLLVEK